MFSSFSRLIAFEQLGTCASYTQRLPRRWDKDCSAMRRRRWHRQRWRRHFSSSTHQNLLNRNKKTIFISLCCRLVFALHTRFCGWHCGLTAESIENSYLYVVQSGAMPCRAVLRVYDTLNDAIASSVHLDDDADDVVVRSLRFCSFRSIRRENICIFSLYCFVIVIDYIIYSQRIEIIEFEFQIFSPFLVASFASTKIESKCILSQNTSITAIRRNLFIWIFFRFIFLPLPKMVFHFVWSNKRQAPVDHVLLCAPIYTTRSTSFFSSEHKNVAN